MLGLIEEGREMMGEKMLPDILDASLITTAQKVEHYEIAGYGCTATYAKLLGLRGEKGTASFQDLFDVPFGGHLRTNWR